jgi:putative cell wall-binding protein
MVTGLPQVSSPAHAHPVKSRVHKVGFVKSSVAAMRTARDATRSVVRKPGAPDPITTARAAAVTPAQDVAGAVTVVGVTWPKGAVSPHSQFQIRTLTAATWSQWQTLGVIDGGPDATEASGTATAGTDPFVVTGASKYEVRSLTTDANVPAAATVQVVDPGTSSADNVAQAPGAAAAATAKPTILTRAAWGADETLRRGVPIYGQVEVGFVHHTADSSAISANTYTAEQVPAMIRGIYAYHVNASPGGLGWDDIGYNFLIDRFGHTWEGRYGGMDKAVVGAQTLSYNSLSTGVAAIGNFDIAPVPQVVTNAFKQIFAWKFSLAGIPATGPSPVLAPDGKTQLQRVSGHRDAFATVCPGQYLYAQLPEIRTGAAAIMNAPATLPHPRLAGADRYATAVVISQYAFKSQYTGQPFAVTVASGTNFPDALAAGPVAAAAGGPLLLVPSAGGLPAIVSAELTRLNPSSVNIAGGAAAVSLPMGDQLSGFGAGTVNRLAGQDRYDTAAQLAGLTGGLGKTVFIASGASFPDALGGSVAAGRLGGALLLTDRNALPTATISAITSGKPAKVVILGGEAVIDPAVLSQVHLLVPGATVERWWGPDRYATAAAISSNTYLQGATTAYLASAADFPDALAGAPVAALAGAPLLLTQKDCVPTSTLAELQRLGATQLVVLGGTNALSEAAASLTPCAG